MASSFNIQKISRLSRCLAAAALIYCLLHPAEAAAGPEAPPPQSEPDRSLSVELPPGFLDSTAADSAAFGDRRVKSPGGAVLRALALPGWGQFYTGHPVRGAAVAALETAFFIGAASRYHDRSRLRDELRELEKTVPVEDPQRLQLNARIKSLGQRGGDFLAYGLTTLLLSVIDSYVSAHLYRFDRNFRVMAGPGTVQLCCRF